MDEREADSGRHDEARALLRSELNEAVGEKAADRAERKGALDDALGADSPRTIVGVLSESRALIAISLFVALIVGAVIALITGSWWFLLIALVLHGVGTLVVVTTALSLASEVEHPDPRTVAALEEHGVADPDAALNQAVAAAAEDSDDDAAAQARDQQTAITPSPDSRPTGTSPRDRD